MVYYIITFTTLVLFAGLVELIEDGRMDKIIERFHNLLNGSNE